MGAAVGGLGAGAVDAQVPPQAAPSGEGLQAEVAVEGPLPGMSAHVLLQVAGVVEGHRADGADVGPGLCLWVICSGGRGGGGGSSGGSGNVPRRTLSSIINLYKNKDNTGVSLYRR